MSLVGLLAPSDISGICKFFNRNTKPKANMLNYYFKPYLLKVAFLYELQ